ncbi:MAG: hypothetical protein BWY76_02252 [bacterium ADurb.Bin429]|nr:MAG: hypothetical protein BWY76_02252 [bacterium ADurb.Bin429]
MRDFTIGLYGAGAAAALICTLASVYWLSAKWYAYAIVIGDLLPVVGATGYFIWRCYSSRTNGIYDFTVASLATILLIKMLALGYELFRRFISGDAFDSGSVYTGNLGPLVTTIIAVTLAFHVAWLIYLGILYTEDRKRRVNGDS